MVARTEQSDMTGRSRRDLLRAGVAATAAVAGCSRLESGSGPTDTGTYLDWLPAPGPLDREPYAVHRTDLREFRDHQDAVHMATLRVAEPYYSGAGPILTEALGAPGTVVHALEYTTVLGGFPVDDATTSLLDAGYQQVDSHREFDVLRRGSRSVEKSGGPPLLAVGDGSVVAGRRDGTRTEIEAIVDAHRGDRQRYHDRNERVRTVGLSVGERTMTRLSGERQDDRLPGLVASAVGWDLGDRRTSLDVALQFEDAADAGLVEVGETFGDPWLTEYRDVSVARDGATIEVAGDIATGRFDFTYPGDPGEDGIPNTRFEVDGDRETVTATHAGQQPVPADRLRVVFRAIPTALTDPEPTERQFPDRYETVEEGDSLVVEPDRAGLVVVEWHHAETDDVLPLGSHPFDPA